MNRVLFCKLTGYPSQSVSIFSYPFFLSILKTPLLFQAVLVFLHVIDGFLAQFSTIKNKRQIASLS